MSEELGECPNNTENTVCLSLSCKYKHDRVWPIPPAIQKAMERELDEEVFYAERVNTPPPREWTPEDEISFEAVSFGPKTRMSITGLRNTLGKPTYRSIDEEERDLRADDD